VIVKRVLRRIFTPKKNKMIKSKRIRWAGHVACISRNRNAYKSLREKL
jgi:hypothetical protein